MSRGHVYVDVRHSNFWWGIYGLCSETNWEDVLIYPDREENTKPTASFCLSARSWLRGCLDSPVEGPKDEEFNARINHFLDGDELQFWFTYGNPQDTDFWEVAHNAPRNEQGIKPYYIEVWYPAEGIGLNVLRHSVEEFCRQMLDMDDVEVHLRSIEPFEEAADSFEENAKLFAELRSNGSVVVTEEVIEALAEEMEKTPEQVEEAIRRSANMPIEVRKKSDTSTR